MEKYTISRNKDFYQAWPSMVKLEGDVLFCIFTRCKHHLNREASVLMYTKSYDRGRTWEEAQAFTEITQKEHFYNNARVRNLGGKIVIVCDKVYGNENQKVPADVYMWISCDEARTFQKPIKTRACGIVPDIKELSNGSWILTAHRKDQVSGKLVQYAWISKDNGKCWSDEIVVGKDERYNLCEASILECSDNTLVAFMRENSARGCDCMKAISTDGGFNWSGVYNAPIPGCHRPTAGFLQNRRVMITYRFAEGSVWGAENTFIAVTDENSAKATERPEQKVRIMPLDYDRNENQDSGYTDWTQFDDGEIYIVNYIKDDHDKGQIRGYSLKFDEIVLSEG